MSCSCHNLHNAFFTFRKPSSALPGRLSAVPFC